MSIEVEGHPRLSSRAAKAAMTRRAVSSPWPRLVLLLLLLVPVAITVIGASYYFAPLGVRVRHPQASWLKPSGVVGQTLGIAALAMFLFLWLYPLRKRFRPLRDVGSMPRWLDWHIVAGISAPLFGAAHAGWRFHGLVGLGYGAMALVALSGFLGRYLYKHLPKSLEGVDLTQADLAQRRTALLAELQRSTGVDADLIAHCLGAKPTSARSSSLVGALVQMVRDDLWRRRTVNDFVRSLDAGKRERAQLQEILRLARAHVALDQQARMLGVTQRLFHHWHVAHMPVAIAALAAVIIHVAVVIVVGATWFW
jgi:hypothetical protein